MQILKLITATLLLATSAVSMTETTPQQIQQQQNPLMIDVRSKDEFDAGHLQSAVHIPHDQIERQISRLTTDKDQKIYVYCRSGRRAEAAKAELEKLGYRNVENLGGYAQLKADGVK
ncbi:hypothetical protein OA57_04645 [Chelonobacter oris]|uniref:Rhodanese domain-containing protein n=1 Tax=Chelonobacter oris TaxID=505317 RepID=A0A0A3AMZ6_9PAST|nr:rhodanese-like domain-containing protein [Chelonobacter oris]KGQ70661.1 hypothetical protein OA57_04645 [Chelonobacter oris]